LTALLLMLAVFGTPAASFAAVRLAPITVVCAGERQPGQKLPISQPPSPAPSHPSIRINTSAVAQPVAEVSFRRERFQRPPPFRSSLA